MSINTYSPLKEKKKIQAFCYYIFAQNSNLIHSNKLNIDFFFQDCCTSGCLTLFSLGVSLKTNLSLKACQSQATATEPVDGPTIKNKQLCIKTM